MQEASLQPQSLESLFVRARLGQAVPTQPELQRMQKRLLLAVAASSVQLANTPEVLRPSRRGLLRSWTPPLAVVGAGVGAVLVGWLLLGQGRSSEPAAKAALAVVTGQNDAPPTDAMQINGGSALALDAAPSAAAPGRDGLGPPSAVVASSGVTSPKRAAPEHGVSVAGVIPATKNVGAEGHAATLSQREPTPITTNAASSASAGEDPLLRGLHALERAEAALREGRTVDARRELDGQQVPAALATHATALRAILACQSGDLAAGRRLTAEQAQRFPNSPYLKRMQNSCSAPPLKLQPRPMPPSRTLTKP